MRYLFILMISVVLVSCGKKLIVNHDTGRVAMSKSTVPEVSSDSKKLQQELQTVYDDAPFVGIVQVINETQVILPSDKLFPVGESTMDGGGELLMNFMSVLANYPDQTVRIECLTDSSGSSEKNLVLSKLRAESVRLFLIDHGLSAASVSATGYGEQFPIASNVTSGGRELNRRVVLTVGVNR